MFKGTTAADDKEEIHTIESIEVERIGNEKGHMKPYVNIIADLTEMTENLRRHFITQCENSDDPINVIISQRDGAKYMSEVHPEQLGLHQHHLLPNVSKYQNGFTGSLILAGDMGIDEQLIDNEYPVFHIHEKRRNISVNILFGANASPRLQLTPIPV